MQTLVSDSIATTMGSKSTPRLTDRPVASVVYAGDLRLHDHEALVRACDESEELLPVFCFDPRDFPCDSKDQAFSYGGSCTGPSRARFLLQVRVLPRAVGGGPSCTGGYAYVLGRS